MIRRKYDKEAAGRYQAAREQVYQRAGKRCEICGAYLVSTTFHAHHRLLRSAVRVDCPCNLLALCGHCHNASDESVHSNPQRSRDLGQLISRHEKRMPREVLVVLRDGTWFLGCRGEKTVDLSCP